jgi:NAD(P)-dependent dehydrogenase (short-subunit alcohol dehydrogenase family)/CMP-N-acetylneuraminic acid synthetase
VLDRTERRVKRLCTICARGGSKGAPNKNLRLLLGKPLLVHSIEQARTSCLFERISVSSDSADILALAQANGAETIERPADLATDTAPKIPVIHHALLVTEARQNATYDTLVDLDVTSPLRLSKDIRGAVALLESSRVSAVVTGTPSFRSPYFNLIERSGDGSVVPAKLLPTTPTRRQDVPPTFDMNASIYVWNADKFRDEPKLFYHDTRLFEMPPERSHDIDNEFDFEIVEMLLRRRTSAASRAAHRFDLSGKVAMVTGGAGILGRHFVRGLAEHGAAVAILDLDQASVEMQAKLVRDEIGAATIGLACDITDLLALRKAVDRIESELGPIDVLHNNAATKGHDLQSFFAPVENYDIAVWREIMAVNVDAMFLVAQEVGKRMVSRRKGSIIQTASVYGLLGPDQRIYEGSEYLGRPINTPAVYSTSKAGVIGLSRHLAAIWATSNVRVNTLAPGGVESGQNDTFKDRYAMRVPLGRMALPEEMTGALIFLASDSSSYITGQTLAVDGGLTAW